MKSSGHRDQRRFRHRSGESDQPTEQVDPPTIPPRQLPGISDRRGESERDELTSHLFAHRKEDQLQAHEEESKPHKTETQSQPQPHLPVERTPKNDPMEDHHQKYHREEISSGQH